MDISSLSAFIMVAQEESFSKASLKLHITQPAVSKRVASLEQELGVNLFNRVAKVVSLTEAGKQLLPKAHELVSQAKELQQVASNLSDEIRGNLSISIAHHIGLYRMQSILKEFDQLYSEVDLDIRFEDSEQALSSVEKGDIEFGLITLPSHLPDNIDSEVVWKDSLKLVVTPDHVLAKIGNVDVEDLCKYRCVLPTKETETHQVVSRIFESKGIQLSPYIETCLLYTSPSPRDA